MGKPQKAHPNRFLEYWMGNKGHTISHSLPIAVSQMTAFEGNLWQGIPLLTVDDKNFGSTTTDLFLRRNAPIDNYHFAQSHNLPIV